MSTHGEKMHQKRKRSDLEIKLCNVLEKIESNSKVPKRRLPSSLVVQDEELEFPRGGGSILIREEKPEACAEADDEFDKEKGLTRRGRKKHKNKMASGKGFQAGEDEWGSLFGQGFTGKLPSLTNRITWKIVEEKQRIALGIKQSYVKDAMNANVNGSNAAMNCTPPSLKQDNLSCFDNINGQQDDGASTIHSQAESQAFVLPLHVCLDDSEGTLMKSINSASQDNANEVMEVEKMRERHLQNKKKQKRELEISAFEERSLHDMPQTIDDFEKLVRSSPNSSFLWIKYMEFILAQADVEKARSIAERALKTVIIQEEGERLNIWVAYFNLENAYGNSPEVDVERVFKRALQTCDPKKLYLSLLGMYERTKQHKLADSLLDEMTKKFKKSCKVWLCRVQHFLKQEKDGIQAVINRALLSLPVKKHIKFISHTAIREFKCGVPDLGRSMFEGILRDHPKRTDLWSIYLDQEIHLGDQEIIRLLFERATCLSLSTKKMKFLFKKYHAYEESQGDQERVEHVKKKALQYLEMASS